MNEITKELIETIANEIGAQKMIVTNSAVRVYFGMSNEGYSRLSFMSSVAPPKMESTKLLKVIQGKESGGVYWTSFDLLEPTAKQVFYSFCIDLINAVNGVSEEKKSLVHLKNRFHVWKTMFKKGNANVSAEVLKGLFGELYFIDTYLVDKIGIDEAILAWSGSDGTAKDFSVGTDWYEIKAVSASSVSVKIASVSQLTSGVAGHLVIIRLESMSPIYTDGQSSIGELFHSILTKIVQDETKEKFLGKIVTYGLNMNDDCCTVKFCVASAQSYRVDDFFPRLTEADIRHREICKVCYELIINSLERFKEDAWRWTCQNTENTM